MVIETLLISIFGIKPFWLLMIIIFILMLLYSDKEQKEEEKKNKLVIDKSHKEIMDSFKNKQEIISYFGFPDTQKNQQDFEEWYYDKGKIINTSSSSVNKQEIQIYNESYAGFNDYPVTEGEINKNEVKRITHQVLEHKKYVKFIFKNENIIKWETEGVNLSTYIKAKYKK